MINQSYLKFRRLSINLIINNAFKILLFSLSLAISANIKFYLPFSSVPFTFQVLVIYLIVFFNSRIIASLSVLTYLFFGCANLPFFANNMGLATMIGPTGGYLIGFIFAALVAGEKEKSQSSIYCSRVNYLKISIKGLIVLFIIYTFGFLGLLRFMNPASAFKIGIIPFIIFDIYKLIIAIFIYFKIKR